MSLVLLLAACAPVYDTGRTTKDEGRVALVMATPTVAPTATLLPTATPTLTPTATPTFTPTPTLTEAERRATQLPSLADFKWQAKGDDVVLIDPQNPQNVLAQIDWKSGALRWDSKKNFASLNRFIRADASPSDRATLTSFLSELKKQGIHFLSFADTRAGYPPYAVILTADGKGIVLVQGPAGTGDYLWDTTEGRNWLAAIYKSREPTRYYRNNPDGMILGWYDQKTGKFEKTFLASDGKTHFADGGWLLPYLVDDVAFDNPEIQKLMIQAKQNPLYKNHMKDVSYYLVVPPPTNISDDEWSKYIGNLPISSDFTPQQKQLINQALKNINNPFIRAAMINGVKGIDPSVYGYHSVIYERIKLWQPYIISLPPLERAFVHEGTHALQQKITGFQSRSRYIELQALVNELEHAMAQNDTIRINMLIPYILDLSWSRLYELDNLPINA